MDRPQEATDLNGSEKDMLYILGGAALIMLGAGLLLSNRTVRQSLNQFGVGSMLGAAMPDVDRYLKLRSM